MNYVVMIGLPSCNSFKSVFEISYHMHQSLAAQFVFSFDLLFVSRFFSFLLLILSINDPYRPLISLWLGVGSG